MEETKTKEQLELESAQRRLDEAKKRVADAEQLKLQAARVALAEREAEVQRQLHEQAELIRANEERHAKRKADQAAKEAAERAAEEAKQRQLESEFAAREEEERQRAAHEEAVRKVQEAAFQMETEARRLEAEAIAVQTKPASEIAVQVAQPAESPEQVDGLDHGPSGLESATGDQWGTPALRRLLPRQQA